ncbi:reverse transcriptase-like protein [Lacticaseibacillus saniviri]
MAGNVREDRVITIYADGSKSKTRDGFGIGLLILDANDNVILAESRYEHSSKYDAFNQIPGELHAVLDSLQFAVDNGFHNLSIFHDYDGAPNFSDKSWKARTDVSRDFVNKFNSLEEVGNWNIVWDKPHSETDQQRFNFADKLAKHASTGMLRDLPNKFE